LLFIAWSLIKPTAAFNFVIKKKVNFFEKHYSKELEKLK